MIENQNKLNDPHVFKNIKKCALNVLVSIIAICLFLCGIIYFLKYIQNNLNFVYETFSPYIIGTILLMIFCSIVTGCLKEKTNEKYKETLNKIQIALTIFLSTAALLGIFLFFLSYAYTNKNYDCDNNYSYDRVCTRTSE